MSNHYQVKRGRRGLKRKMELLLLNEDAILMVRNNCCTVCLFWLLFDVPFSLLFFKRGKLIIMLISEITVKSEVSWLVFFFFHDNTDHPVSTSTLLRPELFSVQSPNLSMDITDAARSV